LGGQHITSQRWINDKGSVAKEGVGEEAKWVVSRAVYMYALGIVESRSIRGVDRPIDRLSA
jgi:hypothetical protein